MGLGDLYEKKPTNKGFFYDQCAGTLAGVTEVYANEGGELDPRYHDHELSGDYAGTRECHIKPDWLLVWEQHEKELTLLMLNTGTHSDIFNK